MDELDPRLQALLGRARSEDGPDEDQEQRVRSRLIATLAAVPGGSGLEGLQPGPEVGGSASTGAGTTWAGHGLFKWLAATLLLGGGALGVATWGSPTGTADVAVEAMPGVSPSSPGAEPRRDLPAAPAAVVATEPPQPSLPVDGTAEETVTTHVPPAATTPVAAQVRGTKAKSSRAHPNGVSSKRVRTEQRTESGAPAHGPDELALIRQATKALRDRRPEEALRLLAGHARHFPDGMLAEERRGLRVLALCAAGRRAEGSRQRARFLSQVPRSPLAARVQDACAPEGGSSEEGVGEKAR